MKKLTKSQRQEIVDGIEEEGMEYYFINYTNKWEEFPNEIQNLVRDFRLAQEALEDAIDAWNLYPSDE